MQLRARVFVRLFDQFYEEQTKREMNGSNASDYRSRANVLLVF